MANVKWEYLPAEDSAIRESSTDNVVWYVDDINPEIITEIVTLVNKGKKIEQIKDYLQEEVDGGRMTPDEQEFAIENIEATLKADKGDAVVNNSSIEGGDLYVAPEDDLPFKMTEQEVAETIEQMTSVAAEVQQPVKKVKKANTATIGKKKVSAETMKQQIESQMEALKEKLQLVEILQNVPAPEFPENLTVAGRKIMLELQKEHRALIDKYAEQISEM